MPAVAGLAESGCSWASVRLWRSFLFRLCLWTWPLSSSSSSWLSVTCQVCPRRTCSISSCLRITSFAYSCTAYPGRRVNTETRGCDSAPPRPAAYLALLVVKAIAALGADAHLDEGLLGRAPLAIAEGHLIAVQHITARAAHTAANELSLARDHLALHPPTHAHSTLFVVPAAHNEPVLSRCRASRRGAAT
eukprot:scaffold2727_cov385-Prasinococcus_capsulatus_cf.AAC.2